MTEMLLVHVEDIIFQVQFNLLEDQSVDAILIPW
jgi:hypothetical protein